MAVKVILLDLDGTLLTPDKTIAPADYAALERAAGMGIHIVPATGRFYDAIPEVVRRLPFVRYVVTVNGAEIFDAQEKKVLRREDLTNEEAVRVYEYLEGLPVICDAYVEGWGYMSRAHQARVEEFTSDPHVVAMLRGKRTPVDDMRRLLRERRVQKIMAFFKDMDRRALELKRLPERFPNTAVSSSIANNIEVNAARANKGDALKALCGLLGVDVAHSMAFGDGSNDLTMLRAAGIGVAMGNAAPEVQAAADYVTRTNEEGGVSAALEKFVFEH